MRSCDPYKFHSTCQCQTLPFWLKTETTLSTTSFVVLSLLVTPNHCFSWTQQCFNFHCMFSCLIHLIRLLSSLFLYSHQISGKIYMSHIVIRLGHHITLNHKCLFVWNWSKSSVAISQGMFELKLKCVKYPLVATL